MGGESLHPIQADTKAGFWLIEVDHVNGRRVMRCVLFRWWGIWCYIGISSLYHVNILIFHEIWMGFCHFYIKLQKDHPFTQIFILWGFSSGTSSPLCKNIPLVQNFTFTLTKKAKKSDWRQTENVFKRRKTPEKEPRVYRDTIIQHLH